ncbi:MAG TPA: response regulator transcription factor [Candidatus Limnocylindrales bacterium]|nr:response regulator transcription factor [Candidatus Limnocylindrales bacterium]
MSAAAPEPTHAPVADPGTSGARRILVVDADDRTRESVAGILTIRHRFEVVGTAGHSGEALRLAREGRPQVVILDPRLPEVTDGMSLIRRLRAIDPGIAILVVGWSPELEHRALDAGADAFVRKTFKPGDLAAAITRCHEMRAHPGSGAAEAGGPVPAPLAAPSTEAPTGPVPVRGAGLVL